MSKGSKQRPTNKNQFDANYDQIFKSVELTQTPYDLLDKEYAKEVNKTVTVIDFQRYLNKHGWTMNEWSNEGFRRSQKAEYERSKQ